MDAVIRVAYDMAPAVMGHPGVGRYTVDLADALARRPDVRLHRLDVPAVHGRGGPGRWTQRIDRALARQPLMLARRAARSGAHLIHCPVASSIRSHLPVVMSLHDPLPWGVTEPGGAAASAPARMLLRRAARRAGRVLVPSMHARGEVVELLGLDERRVAVATLGVGARFRPISPDPTYLAHRFGIPPDPFVLWVGAPGPRKNLSVLLRAFALVRRRAPECSLVLVGGAPITDRDTAREVELLGRAVIQPGFISDDELAALYSSTGCFVFPSLHEGFGLPALEAMACGAPVVAADRASLPEVVGDAGILVGEPGDPDALADAIERVVLHPDTAADLSRRGRLRAREFTWQRCAEQTVEAYRAALADQR